MPLTWYTSVSADEDNHDQEVDLDAIGSPGGASWASVSPNDPGWHWEIFDRWLDVDEDPDPTLAVGEAGDEAGAKVAVESWVEAQA